MLAEHIAAYLRSIGEHEMGEEVMQMHSRLEAFADGTDRAAFDGMKQAAEAAFRQRDELLAALELIAGANECVGSTSPLIHTAKAAIASVKGGAA